MILGESKAHHIMMRPDEIDDCIEVEIAGRTDDITIELSDRFFPRIIPDSSKVIIDLEKRIQAAILGDGGSLAVQTHGKLIYTSGDKPVRLIIPKIYLADKPLHAKGADAIELVVRAYNPEQRMYEAEDGKLVGV